MIQLGPVARGRRPTAFDSLTDMAEPVDVADGAPYEKNYEDKPVDDEADDNEEGGDDAAKKKKKSAQPATQGRPPSPFASCCSLYARVLTLPRCPSRVSTAEKKKKAGGGGADGEQGENVPQADAPATDIAGAEDAAGDAGGDGEVSAAKKKRDKQKAAAARKKAEAAVVGGGGEAGSVPIFSTEPEWSSIIRGIKPWGKYPAPEKGGKPQQHGGEWGLTTPVLEQFPSGEVPHGMEVEYQGEHQKRITSAEKRERREAASL